MSSEGIIFLAFIFQERNKLMESELEDCRKRLTSIDEVSRQHKVKIRVLPDDNASHFVSFFSIEYWDFLVVSQEYFYVTLLVIWLIMVKNCFACYTQLIKLIFFVLCRAIVISTLNLRSKMQQSWNFLCLHSVRNPALPTASNLLVSLRVAQTTRQMSLKWNLKPWPIRSK